MLHIHNEKESILTVLKSQRCMLCTSLFGCWLPCHILKVGFSGEDLSKNESEISLMYKPQQKYNYIKGISVQMFIS